MAQFILAMLALTTSLSLIGPGALAPADPGVLENVQSLRVRYGWGLQHEAPTWATLAAVEDCDYLGYSGYAMVEGLGAVPVRVVDCQRMDEAPRLAELGIVADVADVTRELGHREATLILWRDRREQAGSTNSR